MTQQLAKRFAVECARFPGLERILQVHPLLDVWVVLDILFAPDDACSGRTLFDILLENDMATFDRYIRQATGDGYS